MSRLKASRSQLNGTSSTSKLSTHLKGSTYVPPPFPEIRNRTTTTEEDMIEESSEVTSRFVPNSAREHQ